MKKKTTTKATKTTTRRTRKTAKPKSRAKTATRKTTQGKKRGGTPTIDAGPQDKSYRVFHLPTGLKEACQAWNATTPESTMEQVFESAVDSYLDGILDLLAKAGVANGSDRSPIRVKVSDATLEKLAKASQQTGLDQRQLLCCCLTHSTAE